MKIDGHYYTICIELQTYTGEVRACHNQSVSKAFQFIISYHSILLCSLDVCGNKDPNSVALNFYGQASSLQDIYGSGCSAL